MNPYTSAAKNLLYFSLFFLSTYKYKISIDNKSILST